MRKILILTFAILLMAGSVGGETFPTGRFGWQFSTDSTWMYFYKNGSITDSAKRTTAQSYDTSFTYYRAGDTCYNVVFSVWAVGEDSAHSTQFNFGNCTGPPTGVWASFLDTLFAVDTSGADVAVADVKITITNAAGEPVDGGWTNGSGYRVFGLDTGTYTVVGKRIGYSFPSFSHSFTASGRDSLKGYDKVVSSPGAADICVVHGWVYNAKGDPRKGTEVTAIRKRWAIADTGSTAVIVDALPYAAEPADTLGYFELFLRKTTTFSDTTEGFYDITGRWGGKDVFSMPKLYVPDQDSLNLADTLALMGR